MLASTRLNRVPHEDTILFIQYSVIGIWTCFGIFLLLFPQMNCIAIIVSMPVLASALPLLCKKLQRSVVKRLQCQWPLFKLLTLPDICFYLFFSSLLSLSLFFPPLHPPSDTSTFYFLSFVFFAAPSLSLSFSSLHPHSDTAASVISSQNFCLLFLISACLVLSSPLLSTTFFSFSLLSHPLLSPLLPPSPPPSILC